MTDYHLLPGREKQFASELKTEFTKPAETRAGDSPRLARAIFDGISAPNLVKLRKNKISEGLRPATRIQRAIPFSHLLTHSKMQRAVEKPLRSRFR